MSRYKYDVLAFFIKNILGTYFNIFNIFIFKHWNNIAYMLYYKHMFYIFYPKENIHINKSQLEKDMTYIEYKDEGGYVSIEINNLFKKRKNNWLYLKVVDFLDKLAEEDDLSAYFNLELLKAIGDGLIEMRIPKTDKKGVFRIYYRIWRCYWK